MADKLITVGTDLILVSRVAALIERHGATFLDRVFTPAEQDLCRRESRRLAGRWAAKESVLKALGLGIGGVPMTAIEVLAEASGAPVLRLVGPASAASDRAGWTAWSISIAHDGEYASAVAVALA